MPATLQTDNFHDIDVLVLPQLNDVYHIDMRADFARDDSMILPRVGTLLDRARARLGADRVQLVVPGDFLAPSGLSRVFEGSQMVAVFNALGVHFVSLGNHEFDAKEPAENILRCMDEAEFTWLATNFQFLDPSVDDRFSDHPRMKMADAIPLVAPSVQLVLLGLLYPGEFGGVGRATDPVAEARRMILQLEGHQSGATATHDSTTRGYMQRINADPFSALRSKAAYVALSHQDDADDAVLADAVPHLMAVLGGHDHDVRNRAERFVSHVGKALSNARSLRFNWYIAIPIAQLQKIQGFGTDTRALLGIADELFHQLVVRETMAFVSGDARPSAADFDSFRQRLLSYFKVDQVPAADKPHDFGGLLDVGQGRSLSCRVVGDQFVFAFSLALDTVVPEFIDLVPECPKVRGVIDAWLQKFPEPVTPILRSPLELQLADAAIRCLSTNFGNFVADIMAGHRRDRNPNRPRADVAVINGGAFRLDRAIGLGEPISPKLLCDIFYHDNCILHFDLLGSDLEQIIKACLALKASAEAAHGDFVQLAGMRVFVKGMALERIVCRDAGGTWLPLQPGASYTLATNYYVARQCSNYEKLFAKHQATKIEPDVRIAVRDEFVAIGAKPPSVIAASFVGLDEQRWQFV